ncbi:MAG TPA: 3'(2'),5'-bisphosphate nucleotidase CysQ [Methylovorus sp.]|nr:3'(2'),5'-bisphosphate nucleotidase CysQ [Methylovorus sp.]
MTEPTMALHALLPEVIRIAKEAGKAIMKVYEGEIAVTRKADASPVTAADLAAHEVIENGLQALPWQLPVLSEESVLAPYFIRQQWQHYWLVDPLDGTREFIKRNGEFTVNIALIHEGISILGVVFAPVSGDLYYATQGEGAFHQAHDGAPRQIHARPLALPHITIAGSRSHSQARMQHFMAELSRNYSPPEVISMGSSLKICLVAEGRADVYPRLGLTSEWDTAAGQCVLEQAGGQLVDMAGKPLVYNSKESLLNPEFFACGATPHAWQLYLE